MTQYLQQATGSGQYQTINNLGTNERGNFWWGYGDLTWASCALRWQPNIDITNKIIIIDSAYMRVTYETGNNGAFTAPVGIHDGSAPDLSTTALARSYTPVASNINWSMPNAWTGNTEYTSPDLKNLVQAWFDRSGYSSTDWMAVIVDDGDSQKNEYKQVYRPIDAAAYRPELEINYRFKFAEDINFVPNSVITEVNGVPANNIEWIM